MGGNRSSYEVCFRFFPQTQLHMLLHFSSLQSDLCGMLPNIAVSVPIRGLASARKELCTEAGPTSARAGRTNITAWNAPAVLQLSTETPRSPCISKPAVPQGKPCLKFPSLLQLWSCCCIQLRENTVTLAANSVLLAINILQITLWCLWRSTMPDAPM